MDLIKLSLIIVITYSFDNWTYHIAEKGNFKKCKTSGQIFRAILFRITWRHALISLLIGILFSLGADSPEEAGRVCASIMIISSLPWPYLVYRSYRLSRCFKFPKPSEFSLEESSVTKEHKAKDANNVEIIECLKVMGLSNKPTKEELNAKYRELLDRYNPEKLSQLDDEFIEMAQEKLISINSSYLKLRNFYKIK